MKLTYQTTQADAVAFSMYHTANSRMCKKDIRRYRILFFALFLIWSMVKVAAGSYGVATIYLVFGILSVLFYQKFSDYLNRRHFQKYIKENFSDLYEGPNKYEILDAGILATHDLTQATYKYSAVWKITTDDIRTYIYIAKGSAIILPNDRIPQDQIDAFVAELKVRIEASKDSSESPALDGDF